MRRIGETMRERARSAAAGSATMEAETPASPTAAAHTAVATQTAAAMQARRARAYQVLLVDDHPVVRRGIRAIVESQRGMEVCGEASDGREALELVKKHKPDLVLLDLTMPEPNGLEVTTAVREQSPETEVLILSMHFTEELAREVLRCGALGYVLKTDADEELLAAVDHVRRGQPYFTTKLAMAMTQNFLEGPAEASADPNGQPGSPLTEREVQVVQLLAEGKSNKEVAAALGVSTRTVESHRNHIMHKMKFTSFSELIRYAIRTNLVAP
jgi:DNA-binding NarL/FixJ family response regulator